ncbi:aminoglycoside phosphotransferase [Streptomyces sp. SID5785]|uniref:aminoglycoside phosphotransferase n=1 Tax=Streptomyces sp. SID5785 TaxID=2690309 RepID=UPI0013613E94|nr:aminoglycoside phosphotransferase [Streptomyces sp. SID5785]MZD05475.1 aminoglycoside phosphotransferase [Streptomyces sp. SID5785]
MTEPPHRAVPPPAVLDAFGVTGPAVPLTGGQERCVRVGDHVFKPVEGAEDEAEWAASLSEALPPGAGFRVPRPLRARDGRCVVDGWTGTEFLTGEPGPQGHWSGVLGAGRAFHSALRKLPRPDFLARRTHPWAVGDRVAWGEQDIEITGELATPYADLADLLRPVKQEAAQLVHGDLTGNVLFAPDAPPAVIDFSPYWRPPVFAEAVVVADGLLWFDLPPGLLAAGSGHPDWRQMLLRALVFRLVAQSLLTDRPRPGERERYERAVRSVRRLEA